MVEKLIGLWIAIVCCLSLIIGIDVLVGNKISTLDIPKTIFMLVIPAISGIIFGIYLMLSDSDK